MILKYIFCLQSSLKYIFFVNVDKNIFFVLVSIKIIFAKGHFACLYDSQIYFLSSWFFNIFVFMFFKYICLHDS